MQNENIARCKRIFITFRQKTNGIIVATIPIENFHSERERAPLGNEHREKYIVRQAGFKSTPANREKISSECNAEKSERLLFANGDCRRRCDSTGENGREITNRAGQERGEKKTTRKEEKRGNVT